MSNFAQTSQPVSRQSTASNRGAAAVRRRLAVWLNAYDGPIGYEVRDFEVEMAGDVMWVRATVGLRKITGKWVIVHEHMSEPFDPDQAAPPALTSSQ